MFYVHYGEDQVSLFNSKCQTVILMNYVKKTLNVKPPLQNMDLIPLAAEYKSAINPVGIAEKQENSYANTYLTTRGHYVLVTSVEDEDGVKEYTVHWKKQDESDKLIAALDARTAEEKKKAGAKGAKKK